MRNDVFGTDSTYCTVSCISIMNIHIPIVIPIFNIPFPPPIECLIPVSKSNEGQNPARSLAFSCFDTVMSFKN